MKRFIEYIDKSVEVLQQEEKLLAATDRKDESNLVKIRINVYELCKMVYQSFEKSESGETLKHTYLEELNSWAISWQKERDRAQEFHLVDEVEKGDIKLQTLEDVRLEFLNFWKGDPIKLFKCLADKSRLQILKSLVQEDMYVERLAQRLGLTAATISFHLKKLEDAGAVTSYKDQYYTMYSIKQEVFMTNIIDIIKEESDEAAKQRQRDEEYRKKVLAAFFEYGKLKAIPSQRKKERICLEEIAKSFEVEVVYDEKEVNAKIEEFFEDYCTIRRDMISEGIMVREGTKYIRKK